MGEWNKVFIGDICDTISQTFKSKQEKVVLINTSDVFDGKVINHHYTENQKLRGQFKKAFHKDDILYSEIRPKNRRFGYVDFNSKDYIASTKLMVLRSRKDKVMPSFLYQILKSERIIEELQSLAETRSGTFPQITFSELSTIQIMLPPIEEQKEIARTLSVLDDKIEFNKKINDYLAELAASIFNLKFSKFIAGIEPLPDTWKRYTIGDLDVTITDYVANGSFKSLSDNVNYMYQETDNVLIRLTDYNNNYNGDMVFIDDNAYEFLAKSKLHGDEVIISNVGANVGTVFRCPRLGKRMSLAPNSIMIKSKLFEHYLYMHFVSPYGQQQLLSIVTGSAQPKFNKTNFRGLEIVVPDKRTLTEFNTFYNPINEQICMNVNENAQLSELRDILLPKLMSGEISVANI